MRQPVRARDAAVGLLDRLGLITVAGGCLNCIALRGPIVRAVNYHGTPESSRESLARQCHYYERRFRVVSEGELTRFLAGELQLDRVGLLLTFDDGLRSNYRVAASTLDEFGLKAVFLVPVGFIEPATQPREAQRAFYGRITRRPFHDDEPAESFEPMSWDDLADLLARGHAVGSHTLSHVPLGGAVPQEVLEREIVDSKRIMGRRLGREIRSFCWPK